MNLAFRSNKRSGARRQQIPAPAEVETFESRLLLTTPNILTPTGTVDAVAIVDGTAPTVEFSWEAVDNAESYDLWITSLESFERILLREAIPGTTTSIPVTSLAQGNMRVWARANLTGGTMSAWSPGSDFKLNTTPAVTGPVGTGARHLTADDTPTIQWASANGVDRFQIWLTDVTAGGAVRRFTVDNLTPQLDANGDPVVDSNGNPMLEEIRAFEIPDVDTLQIGRYRTWVRSIDQNGAISKWSAAYQFDVGPKPDNLSPSAPSFSSAPLLTWDAVTRATHYDVFVARQPVIGMTPPALIRTTVTSNSFQIPAPLATGGYAFWVRAISMGTGIPTVNGVWSDVSLFGTLMPPTVIGPVGTDGVVSAVRPTIEWTPIHGAATYEVLVHKRDSKPPFLETLNNSTSLTFASNLPEGDYTVWVRDS